MKSSILLAAIVLLAVALALTQDKPSSSAPLDSQKSSDTALSAVRGDVEVLSDTQGVDFGPYVSEVVKSVRMNWYKFIPEEARPPVLKQGNVSIEFGILPDGKVAVCASSHLRATSRSIAPLGAASPHPSLLAPCRGSSTAHIWL